MPVQIKLVNRKRYLLLLLLLPGQRDLKQLMKALHPMMVLKVTVTECLGSYQQDIKENNGAEWVQGCGQWIHEDCIDQVMTRTDGKDRMCSVI